MQRIFAGSLLILFVLCGPGAPGPEGAAVRGARADAADPADWSVALSTRLVYDVVWSNGRIWSAVDPGGVLVYDPATREFESFSSADGLGSNRIQCLAVNDAGEIWVGSADAGITRIYPDGRTRYLTALPDQLDVRAIAFSGDDAYYGGPRGGGRIVSGLPERTFTRDNGLVDEDVRAVCARDRKAWFGTAGGVSEFDVLANGLVTRNDGLSDLDVRSVAVAGGRVYAGTASRLFVLNESGPGQPVWEPVSPALDVEIVDLSGRGDRLAVLGPDRRVWWRDAIGAPWSAVQAGEPGQRFLALTLDDGGGIRLGGRRFDPAPIGNDVTPLFADLAGGQSPYYRQLYGTQFYGLGVDRQGGAWVGAFPVDGAVSHWRADGTIVSYTAEETGNAIDGFNDDGWFENLKIDLFEATDGAIWVSAFQEGITRMVPSADGDPAGATYQHITRDNSPLLMNRVVSMGEDPHGNIWFCAAGEIVSGDFNAGVDVLTDPANPYAAASWVHIRPSGSPLAGEGLNRISFEGDRVAWLTIRDVGIQRFVYGDGSGFDPARVSDPGSWRTITALPETRPDNLQKAMQVAIGPSGRHWVATDGAGLFAFDYTSGAINLARRYRADSFGSRLLSDNVVSVAVDATGAAWAVTSLGLNRIVEDGFDATSDAYTDLQNFVDFGLGQTYSDRILRPLAGGEPVVAQVSGAAPRLFLVSARGMTQVDLSESGTGPGPSGGPRFALYPNPVRAGEELVLDGFVGEATVEIYDLQGRPLRRTTARPGEVVWRLQTLSGNPVANGLYIVRFVQDGKSSTRTLAVER